MRLRPWIPPLLWVGLIEVLTSWPSPPMLNAPPGSDKLAHFSLYAVLAFLSVRSAFSTITGRSRRTVAVAVLLGTSLFGAIDEFHQRFIPGRSMEFGDWAADSLGALVGVIAFALVARKRKSAPEIPA